MFSGKKPENGFFGLFIAELLPSFFLSNQQSAFAELSPWHKFHSLPFHPDWPEVIDVCNHVQNEHLLINYMYMYYTV